MALLLCFTSPEIGLEIEFATAFSGIILVIQLSGKLDMCIVCALKLENSLVLAIIYSICLVSNYEMLLFFPVIGDVDKSKSDVQNMP